MFFKKKKISFKKNIFGSLILNNEIVLWILKWLVECFGGSLITNKPISNEFKNKKFFLKHVLVLTGTFIFKNARVL